MCLAQSAELQRLHAQRAVQASEVAAVEAQEADATARNTALNRQAGALQAEVGRLGRGMCPAGALQAEAVEGGAQESGYEVHDRQPLSCDVTALKIPTCKKWL